MLRLMGRLRCVFREGDVAGLHAVLAWFIVLQGMGGAIECH